jgi:hypothetical protein
MLAAALVVGLLGASGAAADQEVLAEVRVQGNLVDTDDQIIALAGVQLGMPVGPTTADEVATRLRLTRRFKQVDVLKRYASIADPTRIVLVIIVDDGRVRIRMTGDPDQPTRAVRVRGLNLMFLPDVGLDDSYGFTYGGRLAMADVAGRGSRLSFPLTWGGVKQAGIALDKDFDTGPVHEINVRAVLFRREHPFFKEDEDRVRVTVGAERQLTRAVRVGAVGGWQQVSFLGAEDRFGHVMASVVVDTRQDPMLARNAIYARAAWEHYNVAGTTYNRGDLDLRGYLGLFGQNVLVVRGLRQDADRNLPPYLKPMLGGLANLRGFRAGSAVGDTLMAGSAEMRMPLTSPLSFGRMGATLFFDTGLAYDKGVAFRDQSWQHGYGAGFWFSVSVLQFGVAVGHGSNGATRAHVSGGASF